jgi:hypothetical protein
MHSHSSIRGGRCGRHAHTEVGEQPDERLVDAAAVGDLSLGSDPVRVHDASLGGAGRYGGADVECGELLHRGDHRVGGAADRRRHAAVGRPRLPLGRRRIDASNLVVEANGAGRNSSPTRSIANTPAIGDDNI